MDEVSLLDRRAALVARAEGYLSTEPSFARFLRAVAEATDPEDLGTRGLDELEAVFRRSYGRLGKRELASHNIYVDPPAHPGEPETVEVFCADMPFIVDSVLAAIRARGGVIRSLSHPILKFDPATHLATQGDDFIPITFFQIWDGQRTLISPAKYATGEFQTQPWMK